MKPTKVFLKQAILLSAILIFLFPVLSHAQVKEIISEGAYNMGDGETPSVAEERALVQAKRVAVEQAGTYVESYSKVINLQLTDDEIQVLASGLMEVGILDKKRAVVGEGIHFWVKIKARVQTEKMEEMAKRVKEKDVIEDYKRIQEAYAKSQKDIEELKKELSQAKDEKQKKQVEAKISDEERLFQAKEWFKKGYQHRLNKEYDEAIEAYTNAIALNPNYVRAYNNRGDVYYNKKQYDSAIDDFNRAIELNSNYSNAYFNRGAAYGSKGQYGRAIEDFNKALALNPNDVDAYYNRGVAYNEKGLYEMAIEDYTKTISISSSYINAYYNRGIIYAKKKRLYNKAIDDFSKVIELNPNDTQAINNRGNVYELSGIINRAISDFQKACDMGNENGCKNIQRVIGR